MDPLGIRVSGSKVVSKNYITGKYKILYTEEEGCCMCGNSMDLGDTVLEIYYILDGGTIDENPTDTCCSLTCALKRIEELEEKEREENYHV